MSNDFLPQCSLKWCENYRKAFLNLDRETTIVSQNKLNELLSELNKLIDVLGEEKVLQPDKLKVLICFKTMQNI